MKGDFKKTNLNGPCRMGVVWAGGGVRGVRARAEVAKPSKHRERLLAQKASAGALTHDVSAHSTLSITAFCCWATN